MVILKLHCKAVLQLTFQIYTFILQVFTLATHTYGCRVIQRVLEHCNTEQMAVVIQELHQSTSKLVKVRMQAWICDFKGHNYL